ncbi:hypothetical protein F5Y04DRAFT_286728 [Hypomontagnella monticulosa]|nr:hypothetical protein F5Y04DRAFT_286728 [Hypomontagnella monticulosa]
MCNGKQTEMSCGHVLTHYTWHCAKGRKKPCKEPNLALDAPRAYIHDSCAVCDPAFNVSARGREHKARRAELMKQIGASKSQAEAQRLLSRLDALGRKATVAIGQARHLCHSAVDVEFPAPKNGVRPTGTFMWLNGKCVWVEEVVEPDWPETEVMPEIEHLNLGKPRLRNTKKGYKDPFAGVSEQEFPQITGPPRLRTNKPYTGPRENVVSFDVEEEPRVPRRQPSLRRMKSAYGLSNSSSSDNKESDATAKPASHETVGNGSSSNKTVRPITQDKQDKCSLPVTDEVDEDVWLKLAESDEDAAPRRIKYRITSG